MQKHLLIPLLPVTSTTALLFATVLVSPKTGSLLEDATTTQSHFNFQLYCATLQLLILFVAMCGSMVVTTSLFIPDLYTYTVELFPNCLLACCLLPTLQRTTFATWPTYPLLFTDWHTIGLAVLFYCLPNLQISLLLQDLLQTFEQSPAAYS